MAEETIYESSYSGAEIDDAVGRVKQNAQNWDDNITDLANEVTSRQNGDTALGNLITALQTALNSLQTALNNEATARQNGDGTEAAARAAADSQISGLITALQDALATKVGTTDMETALAGKTDKNTDTGKLEYSQAPNMVLASIEGFNGSTAQYSPSQGDLYFSNGHIYYQKGSPLTTNPIDLNTPVKGLVYCNATNNICYRWTGSTWKTVSGASSSGGDCTFTATIYDAIQANVESIRETLNKLITDLAHLAFTNSTKTASVGSLTWPERGSTDTTPRLTSPSASSFNIGTIAASQSSKTNQLYIKGENLTAALSLSLGDVSGFAVSVSTVSAANANAGVYVTLTYTNAATVAETVTEQATLTITSSDGISKTLTIYGSKAASGGGSDEDGYAVTKTVRNLSISDNTTNNVLPSGTAYQGTVAVDDTTTAQQLISGSGTNITGLPALVVPSNGVTATVNGSGVSNVYSNGQINIPAASIDGAIAITAIAESPVIRNHKVSSGGNKYSSETTGWCYNDAYIKIPQDISHVKWVHYAHSAGLDNAYFSTQVITGAGAFNKKTIQMVTSSVDEQIVELTTSGTNWTYLLASFSLAYISQCKVIGYTNSTDANAGTNGVTLFDGAYATEQDYNA